MKSQSWEMYERIKDPCIQWKDIRNCRSRRVQLLIVHHLMWPSDKQVTVQVTHMDTLCTTALPPGIKPPPPTSAASFTASTSITLTRRTQPVTLPGRHVIAFIPASAFDNFRKLTDEQLAQKGPGAMASVSNKWIEQHAYLRDCTADSFSVDLAEVLRLCRPTDKKHEQYLHPHHPYFREHAFLYHCCGLSPIYDSLSHYRPGVSMRQRIDAVCDNTIAHFDRLRAEGYFTVVEEFTDAAGRKWEVPRTTKAQSMAAASAALAAQRK